MNIEIFMLSGQNNGEKDILRSYYTGILNYFFEVKLKQIPTEGQIVKFTKLLNQEHNIKVNLNYNDVCAEDVDLAVIFGSAKDRENLHHKVRTSVIKNAKNYIVIETPLLNRTIVKASNHPYYRIGLNGFLRDDGQFNNTNMPENRKRFFNIDTKPFKDSKIGNILILLQLPGDASLRESNHGEWLLDTVEHIRSITDRNILIRFHPAMSEKGHENFFKDIGTIVFKNYKNLTWSDGTSTSLNEDFVDTGVCITYSSGSAIDAIIAGVPTITVDSGNFGYSISSKFIDDLNDPYIPSEDERSQWLNDLAYCQWSREEMSNGDNFRHLYPCIQELIND
jgi:hypothetical protein